MAERAQRRGLKVWGETCPQYLVLRDSDMDRTGVEGAKFICSPPPRDGHALDAFWDDIRRGVIDVISSDHSAYFASGPENSKDMNGGDAPFPAIPNGIPGIGARMQLVFSEGVAKGRIDLETFARLTATNPAKIFGLSPRKGAIAPGADADLVLWDPEARDRITQATQQHAVDYTPYEGIEVTGAPVATYLRGQLAMRDGQVLAEPGQGRFLARDPYELARPRGRHANDFDPTAAPVPPG